LCFAHSERKQNEGGHRVKKLWLVVALVALGGLTSKTFADVQNIRLSGDIRIRGYFLDSADNDGTGAQGTGNASFISQRTRVSVEADLEDHVLVVVTLQAEGEWGADSATSGSTGAGSAGVNGKLSRAWDVGVAEAYVQFNELFYTPATLKLGRQYLQYGRGLIISSVEQEYNYDAARLVLDYYPLTIDLVGGELVNHQAFSAQPTHAGASDLLFVNARYELSDSALKDVEAYFGWVSQGSSGPIVSSRVPPTVNAGSPLILGARAERGSLQPGRQVHPEECAVGAGVEWQLHLCLGWWQKQCGWFVRSLVRLCGWVQWLSVCPSAHGHPHLQRGCFCEALREHHARVAGVLLPES
jgi:hypothetical protein